MVFFAIWWAWMNFTWFASAYDTDDVPYRLTTLVQIAGALVLAAGVPPRVRATATSRSSPRLRDHAAGDGGAVAARGPRRPPRAGRPHCAYAVGIAVVQLGWLLRLLLPDGLLLSGVPRAGGRRAAVPSSPNAAGQTLWHPHHIAERYGLFTVIVLGESVPRRPSRSRPRSTTPRPGGADRPRRRRARDPVLACGGSTSTRPHTRLTTAQNGASLGLRALLRVRGGGGRRAPGWSSRSTTTGTSRTSPGCPRRWRPPSRWRCSCWWCGCCTSTTSGCDGCRRRSR